jgi:hypothetical protein
MIGGEAERGEIIDGGLMRTAIDTEKDSGGTESRTGGFIVKVICCKVANRRKKSNRSNVEVFDIRIFKSTKINGAFVLTAQTEGRKAHRKVVMNGKFHWRKSNRAILGEQTVSKSGSNPAIDQLNVEK